VNATAIANPKSGADWSDADGAANPGCQMGSGEPLVGPAGPSRRHLYMGGGGGGE